MLNDVNFDLQTLDFRALTPAQWSVLKSRLIRQAHQRRNTEIRAQAARMFAWPERLMATISRAVGRSWRAFVVARRRRAAVAELSALDDRSLRDIGLRRGEIFFAVYRPEAGPPR